MYKIIKRLFDFFSSLALLVFISPVMLLLAILVRVNLGSPIIFKQKRTTINMKKFYIMKFRTMTDARDSDGNYLPDEVRTTKFGAWLRSTSLDELPELFNIIKGDMSVIGPRPLDSRWDEYYTKTELNRFKVRGGLITPDSVDENPIISYEKQFKYEADYATNLNFLLDVKIFFSVFRILFKRNETDYGSFVRKPLSEERKNKDTNN